MMPDGVESEISRYTDNYFKRTRQAVERYGDATVTYAVFMRRPVILPCGRLIAPGTWPCA